MGSSPAGSMAGKGKTSAPCQCTVEIQTLYRLFSPGRRRPYRPEAISQLPVSDKWLYVDHDYLSEAWALWAGGRRPILVNSSCPQPPFSATYLPPLHHEVEFGFTHKAESPIVRVRKRKFLSTNST